MRDLLAEVTSTLAERRPCVYCAVVETRGSTPQKAGAAMLVFPDGSQRGTLGGGCVEAEVRQRALRLLTDGAVEAEILSFYLDDNYGWDDGLICGGRMAILADPLTAAATTYYQRYQQFVESGRGCTEAVIVAASAGTVGRRFLFDAEETLVAQRGDGEVPEVVRRGLLPLHKRPAAATREGVAFLPSLPRVTLLIVGGGHVGHAVAKLAAEVAFDVWVLDDRERYASPERFPTATRHLVGDVGATLQELAAQINPALYAIIVTRGHNHDEEALYHLARTLTPTRPAEEAAGYVGMIGSRRKIKLIFEDLLAKGVAAEALAQVHAPLGLDIGSQTVPEIAVSIVAELIACRNLGTTQLPVRRRVQGETGSAMSFALIPAGGKSVRMGRPKLSLPLRGRTVLECVVAALRAGGVERVFVVVAPHVAELGPLAVAAGAHVCMLPHETPDMRATVEMGLTEIERCWRPTPLDPWLLVPADHPTLEPQLVARLLCEYEQRGSASILVPTYQGRRGHPAVLAWQHVEGIRSHPPGQGLNTYLRRHTAVTRELVVTSATILRDLDTPEDYERLLRGE